MRERACEEVEHPDEEEEQPRSRANFMCPFGVVLHADRVVERDKREDGHEGLPWKLGDDVSSHERLPRVRFGGTFTRLVQSALSDECWHDLLDEIAEDGGEHEDREHLVLHSLEGVLGLEE